MQALESGRKGLKSGVLNISHSLFNRPILNMKGKKRQVSLHNIRKIKRIHSKEISQNMVDGS